MKRISLLILVIALLITIMAIICCSSSSDNNDIRITLDPIDKDILLEEINNAAENLNSYSFNRSNIMSVNGGPEEKSGYVSSNIMGTLDFENLTAQMEAKEERNFDDDADGNAEKTINTSYILNNRVYWGEYIDDDIQWYTEEVDEEVFNFFRLVDGHIQILNWANVTLLDSEKLGDIPCYVLDLTLDRDTLLETMIIPTGLEEIWMSGKTWDEFAEEFMEMVTGYEFRQWYSADSFLLVKAHQFMECVEDTGDSQFTLTYEWFWDFDGHNEGNSIDLPEEARNAIPVDSG